MNYMIFTGCNALQTNINLDS